MNMNILSILRAGQVYGLIAARLNRSLRYDVLTFLLKLSSILNLELRRMAGAPGHPERYQHGLDDSCHG